MAAGNAPARLTGLLYLLFLPTCGFAYASGELVRGASPAATLANIEAARPLFELAIVAGVIGFVLSVVVALLLRRLLSPVGKQAADLMVALVVTGVPVSLAGLARRMDILTLIDTAAGESDRIAPAVALAMQGSDNLIQLSSVFWGLWLFPLGWLVFRSGFLPRLLGVLLLMGGAFYILFALGPIIVSDFETTLFGRVAGYALGLPGVFIGELGLALWLLILGAGRSRRAVAGASAPAGA